MDQLINQISRLGIESNLDKYQQNLSSIIKIQAWIRGKLFRIKRLPLILYLIRKDLEKSNIIFSNTTDDGRVNSCLDEKPIIDRIIAKFTTRVKIPKIRMWYDILVKDALYGWIPVNIKTTTLGSSDNVGNLAICVYSYTDHILNLESENTYENGKMSIILYDKLKNKQYNHNHKKDYYFLVLDKKSKPNSTHVIINSLKGLSVLTPNIHNLPFQVNWNKNKHFHYNHIKVIVKAFIKCLKSSKPSWKEIFLSNIRSLNI